MVKLYRDRGWLYQKYVEEELSMYRMSELASSTPPTICNWLHRFQIPIRSRSQAQKVWLKRGSHSRLGKRTPDSVRLKISETKKGTVPWNKGLIKEMDDRILKCAISLSATLQGVSVDEWSGYVSFEPYCDKFNFRLKEKIRNRDNRTCQLCGKSELLNGRRLAVHHIDGDKMQGCNGKKWYLGSLCMSCNFKKDTIEKEFLIISNIGK